MRRVANSAQFNTPFTRLREKPKRHVDEQNHYHLDTVVDYGYFLLPHFTGLRAPTRPIYHTEPVLADRLELRTVILITLHAGDVCASPLSMQQCQH
jgi:hypothetical protein